MKVSRGDSPFSARAFRMNRLPLEYSGFRFSAPQKSCWQARASRVGSEDDASPYGFPPRTQTRGRTAQTPVLRA